MAKIIFFFYTPTNKTTPVLKELLVLADTGTYKAGLSIGSLYYNGFKSEIKDIVKKMKDFTPLTALPKRGQGQLTADYDTAWNRSWKMFKTNSIEQDSIIEFEPKDFIRNYDAIINLMEKLKNLESESKELEDNGASKQEIENVKSELNNVWTSITTITNASYDEDFAEEINSDASLDDESVTISKRVYEDIITFCNYVKSEGNNYLVKAANDILKEL